MDDSIQSKIMAMAFAMAAEIERDLISQRAKEALAAKKRAGVKLGTPRGVGWSCSNPRFKQLLNSESPAETQAQPKPVLPVHTLSLTHLF